MTTGHDSSQWERLLKNLGAWYGSFTHLSAEGKQIDDIETITTLKGLDENHTVRQTIRYFDTGNLQNEKVLEYSSLANSVLFFEDGAFSQGSVQLAPFTRFGAEFGFIYGERRLRLVQLLDEVDEVHRLTKLTLIRERLEGSKASPSPKLTVEQLLGIWEGKAVTLFSDGRLPEHSTTRLSITCEGERLTQHLQAGSLDIRSTARIEGDRLHFEDGPSPVEVLLLAGGASATCPRTVSLGKPVLLEAGWLIEANLRQRMIRGFSAKGEWKSLTLVQEHRS